MPTKQALKMAYEAGRQMRSEPAERRSVDSCPFDPGSEECKQWLKGFQDVILEEPERVKLEKHIADRLEMEDKLNG